MAHVLIVGATESGKSGLAKQLLKAQIRAHGNSMVYIVLDSMLASWPSPALVVGSFRDFHEAILDAYEDGLPMCVYIDEANMHMSMRHGANWWVMLQSRHWAITVTLITQRPKLVAPAVRDMCTQLHVFTLGAAASSALAEDHACPSIKGATDLPLGSWLHVSWDEKGEKACVKYKLFDSSTKKLDKDLNYD